MKDKVGIKIKGHVKVFKENKRIFSRHNEITTDSLQIIMRCLSSVPLNPSIDLITVGGDFDPVDLEIFDSVYDMADNSITFIANAFEGSFNGTITNMQLRSSLLGLNFAERDDVSIIKDDAERLKIQWTIRITNC